MGAVEVEGDERAGLVPDLEGAGGEILQIMIELIEVSAGGAEVRALAIERREGVQWRKSERYAARIAPPIPMVRIVSSARAMRVILPFSSSQ